MTKMRIFLDMSYVDYAKSGFRGWERNGGWGALGARWMAGDDEGEGDEVGIYIGLDGVF